LSSLFRTALTALRNGPIINELAVCAECKVKSYDPESCRLVAEIVNVSVDEAAMTDGKVDVAKVQPITFDPFNNEYYVLGEKVGNAFSDGKNLK
jgi:flavin reductase (DIM6/NTAB) family NADH-FMN oxidoreductase RutF